MAKERELKERASVLDVKFENIVGEVSRLTLKEERDVEMVKKRAEELADWIKNDTQKLFEQMAKVDRTALDCENKVKTYTLMVNELQASEDRNDESEGGSRKRKVSQAFATPTHPPPTKNPTAHSLP